MWQNDAQRDAGILRESITQLPEPVVRPFLIIMSGLPGTGKSYLSRKLAERLPCVILTSDVLRKVLFPEPSFDASENQRLFSALPVLIEDFLSRNIPVLMDATNLVENHREQLYHVADKLRLKLVIVQVEAPPDVVQERLKARTENPDPHDFSTAGLGVHQKMKTSKENIRRNHLVVDTSRDIGPAIEKIVREVRW
ncbi:MAG: ATP-binding protein [Dehalococcoidia bacterium]|nr:ATP-binding protein [Dehalococcoidia bacterium]